MSLVVVLVGFGIYSVLGGEADVVPADANKEGVEHEVHAFVNKHGEVITVLYAF